MDIIQGYFVAIENFSTGSVLDFLVRHRVVHAVVIFVVFLFLSRVFKWFMSRVVHHFTKKTKTRIDDLIIERTQKAGSVFVILLGAYLALVPLEIPEGINTVINSVILSLIVVCFGVIGARILDSFIDVWSSEWAHKTRSHIDDALLPLFHKTSKLLFIIFCLAVILKIWGANITGLLAGVGIVGMVLGLALKDSLANIFGGISIVMDKSVKVGDKIKLSSGEQGIIEDIGLRSAKLKTYDNELVTVPNNVLANNIITNFSLPDVKNRIGIRFSVEYGSDVEKVKNVVLKSLQGMKHIIYDPKPEVMFTDLADSGLNFVAFVWFTWDKESTMDERYNVKEEATKRIYEALNKSKIGIPFPTRTVYIQRAKK